jgi:flagellar hook-associated protein 2
MVNDLLSTLNKNGSGLRLTELAQTLATAETAPRLNALQVKAEKDSLRLSALSQIRAQFDKLGGVLVTAAQNPVLTVTTSSASLMPRVTDRNLLSPASVPLDVQALATRQVLEFTGIPARDALIEAGTLTLDFGAWSGSDPQDFTAGTTRAPVTLTIPQGTTAEGLAQMLGTVPGINARLLDKGDGTFSLGIVGETGAQNALRITAEGIGGAGAIRLDSLDTTTTNAARQVQAAGDARVLVDGIMVTRPDNVIKGLLPGLDVTLSAVMTGRLEIGRDREAAAQNIQALIGGLNETFGLLASLTQRGMAGGPGGDLAGDRMVEQVTRDLRRLIAEPLRGFGDRAINLADLGIATQRDGTLRFDPPAFDRNFALREADVDALFTDTLRPLTPGLAISGLPGAMMPAGRFSFVTRPDGSAMLDGTRLSSFDLGNGRQMHIVPTGPFLGLSLTTEPGVRNGEISFGRSFAQSLALVLSDAVASTGTLGRRESELGRSSQGTSAQIDALEARAAVLEKRYLTRFAAMEQVVTQMKSTGSYIQNLVNLWSRDA